MNALEPGDRYELEHYGEVEILGFDYTINSVVVDGSAPGAINDEVIVRFNKRPDRQMTVRRDIETVSLDEFVRQHEAATADSDTTEEGE